MRRLLAAARGRQVTLATASLEYVAKLLNAQSGVDILRAHKGGAAAMTDAISGPVDMPRAGTGDAAATAPANSRPSASPRRSAPARCRVPTFIRSRRVALPGGGWYSLHGPAGLPRRWCRCCPRPRRVLLARTGREAARDRFPDLLWSTPEDTAQRLRTDTDDALRLAGTQDHATRPRAGTARPTGERRPTWRHSQSPSAPRCGPACS